MYFVLTERAVRIDDGSTGVTGAGASRYRSEVYWTVSGPFSVSRPFSGQEIAERAAVAALATPTCLSAQVWTTEKLREVVRSETENPKLRAAAAGALRWLEYELSRVSEALGPEVVITPARGSAG